MAHPANINAPTPTVFIIDHDAAVRDALSVSLLNSGFGVLTFATAGHFLSMRQPAENGCLLVELDLKDMGGIDLVSHLAVKQVELPAIIMSARLQSPFQKKSLPPGIVAILQKPFGREELLRSVQLAMGT